MSTPYIHRRGRYPGWYLRVHVPADLRQFVGHHIVRGLGTSDRRRAAIRATETVSRLMSAFDDFRRQVWRRANEMMAAEGVVSDTDRTEILTAAVAEWVASSLHVAASQDVAAVNTLAPRVRAAILQIVDAGTAAADRAALVGQYLGDDPQAPAIPEGPAPLPISQPVPQPVPAQPPPAPRESSKPWPAFIEDFLAKKPGISEKTRKSYRAALGDLEKHMGAKEIRHVKLADLQRYIDHLETRPNARGGTLNRDSVVRQKSHLVTYFDWCMGREYLPEINLKRIQVRDRTEKEKNGTARRAFTESELVFIFRSPLFSGYESHESRSTPGACRDKISDYWFMLVMAMTGARHGELAYSPAALTKLGDVYCVNALHATKTRQSKRLIPVIPDLERTGFIDYARRMERNGGLLFPIPPHNGKVARDVPQAWSKRLNRYIDDIGLTGPDLVGYSFRHACRQMLRAGAIGDELMNKVFGHASGTVGSNYGKHLSAQEARLTYENVSFAADLSHLNR
ncbi:DUF6538 domain-containing protein [Nguyenibacter vanlangensis]|uniref:DUF6538 domain-containing protein n=1 Tax=Nguyenibacter vanlangensis TaxID=1216886 RepID=A0ABZ3D2L2_9PROT